MYLITKGEFFKFFFRVVPKSQALKSCGPTFKSILNKQNDTSNLKDHVFVDTCGYIHYVYVLSSQLPGVGPHRISVSEQSTSCVIVRLAQRVYVHEFAT